VDSPTPRRRSSAARNLWEAYFNRLVGLARTKLRTAPRRAADEEDVALSAFDSFCCGVGAAASRLTIATTVAGTAAGHGAKGDRSAAARGRGKRDWRRLQSGGDPPNSGTSPLAACASRERPGFRGGGRGCVSSASGGWPTRAAQHRPAQLEGFTNEEIASETGCSWRRRAAAPPDPPGVGGGIWLIEGLCRPPRSHPQSRPQPPREPR
jgi:hypothetical protein